jgi:serine/threonine-protein kinase
MPDSTASHPTTSQNLLFGMLAVQMDFITRAGLVQAMRAWVSNKAQPLAEILREQTGLTPARERLLEALIDEHVRAHGGNAQESLASLATPGSVHEDLRALEDGDVAASLDSALAAQTTEVAATGPAASAVVEGPATGVRYRPLRPHARGGLGEVFVALDQELHREVALKEIQHRHAHDPRSRRRFVLEAEITGRLEHPGIVPIHGLGRHQDGRPFYAMRFVHGETLQDAIGRFHELDGPDRDATERRLALRVLLTHFIAVCNAVAFAHSRGVIHRDLKPGNVMLGKFGETLVVDWGLAKILKRSETESQLEEPLPTAERFPDSDTQLGSPIGTPAYMSPEAAAGRLDELGPASDIYSLGATLYTLLTGIAPVPGEDRLAVLERVRQGRWLSARRIKPQTPPALDAVCRKAMALEPAARYATALALAGDLEHWLADEPVSAWREPWSLRVRRWLGRHRSVLLAATAAVLMGLIILTVATLLLNAAYRDERHAREQAAQQETEAQRQRDQAATAFFRLASLTAERAAHADAIQLYEQVLPLQEGLVRDNPLLPDYQANLATSLNNLGNLYRLAGRQLDAETCYRRALALQEPLARDHADQAEYRRRLAGTHSNLGVLYLAEAETARAEVAYRDALAIREELVRDFPDQPAYEDDLAATHNNLGELLSRIGQPDAAQAAFRDALAIQERLAGAHPEQREYQEHLAKMQDNLGQVLQATGKWEWAEAAFRSGLAVREQLVRKQSAITDYQRDLAGSHNNLGILYSLRRQWERAEASYRAAINIREKLVRDNPAVADFQNQLAGGHNNMANMYNAWGKPQRAEASYRQALTIRENLARQHPTVVEFQRGLAGSYTNLGIFYKSTHQPGQAEAWYRQGLVIWERLARDHPTVRDFGAQQGAACGNLANLKKETGDLPAALSWYGRTVGILTALLREDAKNARAREYLRNAYWGWAEALDMAGRPADAVIKWDLALANTADASARCTLRLARALSRARSGDQGQAVAEASELAQSKSLSGETWFALAGIYAEASAAARRDAQLATSERERLADDHASRAIQLLRQARTAGFFQTPAQVAHLKTETAFSCLRGRADLQRLVEEIEKSVKSTRR